MKKHVVIAAGGTGSRLVGSLPKQFTELSGKPVIMHAIQAFLHYAPDISLVLVLHESMKETWEGMCKKHHFHHRHDIATGGPTRFHSVKNGLRLVPDDVLVAVHDAVRPLVSLDTIARTFQFAARFGNAIPVVSPADTVRTVDGAISKAVDREKIRLVQTPQCFIAGRLKKAFNKNYHESFTDEASVLEADGERLFLVEGNHENIKITHASDLLFAEAILADKTH